MDTIERQRRAVLGNYRYLYPAAVKAVVLTTTNIKVMRTKKRKGERVNRTARRRHETEF
jgi:hypothetical protein